ncbi:ABC transporter permease [Chryseolinea lacunae]|uniref:ABC transporter permease n=1 Tax=Chryseolinea lacunae TaxID=2801331 RepID=A0ABS1KML0_9BACT|nr:ABC transporter permease [Chryseolinea lacunae]MBL0740570.1 ABC transporter permease [Chryseolinea lacunae]
MFRNYLVVAWRSLLKHRLFSFINIAGLSLSMAVCMMIMVRTIDFFGYDTFHPNLSQSYRILSRINSAGGDSWRLASTPLPLTDALVPNDQAIAATTSLYPALNTTLVGGVEELPMAGAFTQPSFFRVFGFSLQHGNPQTALNHPYSIVLSNRMATTFFGNVNPLGKTVTLKNFGEFLVTGVLNEPPAKSHFEFDAYVSWSTVAPLEHLGRLSKKSQTWDSFEYGYTYVTLQPHATKAALNNVLNNISRTITKESTAGGSYAFELQPLASVTPGWDHINNDIARGGSWGKIIAEVSIAFIILISATFNYTNLSIARSLSRTREVGIRKLAGARRTQIFAQYIVEAVVIALGALCFAQVMLEFILEYKPFNDSYEFIPSMAMNWKVMSCFLLFALVVGFLAGSLPAWILSSFRPVKMLQNVGAQRIMGALTLRKALLVFQFSLSLLVMIFLSTFYRQFSFLASGDNGFQKDNCISIHINPKDRSVIKTALDERSTVQQVAAVSQSFGSRAVSALQLGLPDQQKVKVSSYAGDAGVVPVFNLTLVAGANFDKTAEQRGDQVLINEAAVKALGLKTNGDAIGKYLQANDSVNLHVAGVLKDFYHEGLGNAIRPMMIRCKPEGYALLTLRVHESKTSAAVKDLENIWKTIYPQHPFVYRWLDRTLEESYSQRATVSLLGFLAFTTLSIAALGLLGLVVYTVETRRKEISIRRVVGAHIVSIIALLSKGYLMLLVVAGCIALPLGYMLSKFFLTNFANQVTLGIGSLVLCFGMLLCLGILLIVPQTYRASIQNPAENLRNE